MLLQMESFLTEVKVFVFIKKPLARISTRNSSLEGAMKCHYALEMPFLMEVQVKMFDFTKTMDYSPWFWKSKKSGAQISASHDRSTFQLLIVTSYVRV